MNIQKEDQGDVVVFTLNGRIDTQGAMELEEALHGAIEANKNRIVLNVEEVRYINSSALRILAEILTYTRKHHGDLYLVGLQPRIKRVFEIIGFDKFFTFHDNVEVAVASF